MSKMKALQQRQQTFPGSCPKHGPTDRWTGSGKCVTCHPKKRGTIKQAMSSLFPDGLFLEYAIAEGMPMFTPDRPCRRGHTGWRYVSAPLICPECVAVRKQRAVDEKESIRLRALAQWSARIDATIPYMNLNISIADAKILGLI